MTLYLDQLQPVWEWHHHPGFYIMEDEMMILVFTPSTQHAHTHLLVSGCVLINVNLETNMSNCYHCTGHISA